MENYVLLKEGGRIDYVEVNKEPTFVNHPKVKRSWCYGGLSALPNSIAHLYASFIFLDGTREEFEWENEKDLISKTNELLSKF